MKELSIKLFNFYLYSSLHIALSATAFTAYTYSFFGLKFEFYYLIYVGCSTLLLYSLHRIFGMNRVGLYGNKGRYAIIRKYKSHIYLYILIASIGAIYTFVNLNNSDKILVLLPAVLSLLYVLPILAGNKRLRDLPFIKIFLISIIWAFICSYIPVSRSFGFFSSLGIFFLAKVIFVFSITIPFDIRDLEVDEETGVQTLISILKVRKAKVLSYISLLFSVLLSCLCVYMLTLPISFIIIELLVGMITFFLLKGADIEKKDAYFSFYLDGTMSLFFIFFTVLN